VLGSFWLIHIIYTLVLVLPVFLWH